MSEPVFSESEYRVQQLEVVCLLREREELKQEIERLRQHVETLRLAWDGEIQIGVQWKRERDEAREAARWLIANLDHAAEYDVETTAERRWPWLREVADE